MALTIEVNGTVYEDALNIRVNRSVHNFCGYFEADTSANPEERLPIKVGDAVRIFADGVSILNGFAELVEVSYDGASHSLYIFGRDRTADAFDSTVSGDKVFKAPNSLEGILRLVLDAGNMTGIGINVLADDIDDFASGESIEAEVGQTIFNFLEPYARKQQVVMTSDENGDIILMRAGTTHSGLRLARGKNILSASFRKKNDKLFNKYIARSQVDPLANDDYPASDIVSQSGETAIDPTIRDSRIIEFNTEEEMNNDTSFNRAEFEANIRRANSVNYSCSVYGHSLNGVPFKVNELAFVDDDFCNISSDLLIHSIEYSYSLSSGSITKFQMTYKDAFTLQAQQEAREASRQTVGSDF